MERESNSMQALCRSGCGFYGNPATDGLCSLCYKEALKKKQQPPNTSSSASTFSSPQSNLMETHTAIPTIPVISPAPSPSPSLSDNKDVSKSVRFIYQNFMLLLLNQTWFRSCNLWSLTFLIEALIS